MTEFWEVPDPMHTWCRICGKFREVNHKTKECKECEEEIK